MMKNLLLLLYRSWGLCAIVAVAMLTTGVQADDLLIVDLTVPNQVTISATAGLSAADASGSDSTGVYFEDFYGGAGGPLAESLVSGDLTSAENLTDDSPDLFRGGSGADPGLNFWSWTADSPATFTAGSLAFTGSATWDLDPAEYSDMLNGNSSGNLYFPADTEDDITTAVFLGTYSVTAIPEPGTFALLALAGLALAAIRKRK